MQGQTHALFNPKTICRLCSNVKISSAQSKAATEWLTLLQSEVLDREKQNYFRFAIIVLQDILGYHVKQDLNFEQGNVEFSFRNTETKKGVCIEVKGTSTKDLFSNQNREKPEHQTPIRQTWDYMGSGNFDYGIATNYRDFVLIDKSKGYSRYHVFDFLSIKADQQKLSEFIAVFSRESILEKIFIPKLYEESVIERREFTKEFYKLYHETRLMMIKEFQENGGVAKDEAIHYAQLLLNRLVFIFFAEDTDKLRKRLFSQSILQSLNPLLVSEYSRYASDTILNLFERLDKGSQKPIEIFGFNGGLFRERIPNQVFFNDLRNPSFFKEVLQYSSLKKEVKLDEFSQTVIDRFGNSMNPIITNLLIMSSFNFQSELNVNILGNIFEQSLTDLEELQGKATISKRKREGIYYTPQYITDYICRNTIIAYLSKKGAKTIDELIDEYAHNIDELEKRFRSIKILDLACGSGAFLLRAVDILLEIHKQIRFVKESKGRYTVVRKGKRSGPIELVALTKWNEEEEARRIIENNIFGVDINEESVEITKLSLFLKIATNNKKLIDLSQNIQVGNSIVNDKSVDPKGFDWDQRFKETLKDAKFDIIIGNPPYVRQELVRSFSEYFQTNFDSFDGKADLYVYFFERATQRLKEGGFLGFISSGKFLEAAYGKPLARYLCSNLRIMKMINFGDLEVFEGVSAYPLILIASKKEHQDYQFEYTKVNELDFEDLSKKVDELNPITIDIEDFINNDYKVSSKSTDRLIEKIKKDSITLKDFCGLPLVGIKTGYNEGYLTEAADSAFVKPYIFGRDLKKYAPTISTSRIIFPYAYKDSSYELVDINTSPEIRKLLLPHKDRLERRAIINEGIKKGNKVWYEYQQINRNLNFDNEYIVYPNVSLGNNFTLTSGKVVDMTGFIVPSNSKYLLGILNSKLVEFLMKQWAILRRGGYLEYKVQYLSKVPVKEAAQADQKLMVERVEHMLDLQARLQVIKQKFFGRTTNTFQLNTLSRRLLTFYDMSFADFLSELNRVCSVKLSLKEQDEWEDYFNDYKNNISKLQDEIGLVNKQIDELVYHIYGITKEEREIIEAN